MKNCKECNSCGKHFASQEDFLKNTKRWRICNNENLWFNCSCGSTLILIKDEYEWYAPTLNMRKNAKNVFETLTNKEQLPLVKGYVEELQVLMQEKEIKIDNVVNTLRKEPLIATKVINLANRLKAANSDLLKIENLNHAVVYIGLGRLKEMLMTLNVKELEINTKHFSIEKFWERSFNQALVLEYLAEKFTPYHNKEELYIIGYMLNIGKGVCAHFFPEKIDKLTLVYNSPKNKYSWCELEKIYQSESYLVLGEIACSIWGLPDSVRDSCSDHLQFTDHNKKFISKKDLATIAHQMTSWINYDLNDLNQDLINEIIERLKISKDELNNIALQLGEYVKKSKMEA